MDKITVTRKELLVNAVLELHWIPEDAYNDILYYIRKRTGQDEESVEEVLREVSGKEEEPVETESVDLMDLVDEDVNIKDTAQKFIQALYLGWHANPGKYDLVLMSAKEFIERFNYVLSLKLCGPISVAKMLSNIARTYGKDILPTKKHNMKFPCGTYAPVTVYSIPVEKTEPEETDTSLPKKTVGNVIREAREEAKLSRFELADLIGYPILTVVAWEEDRYTPSPDALELMEGLFGKDMFVGVKTLPRVH